MTRTGRAAVCAAVLTLTGGVAVLAAPIGGAVCGSVGGRHVDVSGCADPLYEMNYVDDPAAPPPPPDVMPPPPPPPPNVNVCASVGRRINVSGCV